MERASDVVVLELKTGQHYVLWVNENRTRLVRLWNDGSVELCERAAEGDLWAPPIRMERES